MHTGSGSDEEGDDVEDGKPIRCGRAIATDDEWCSWLREDLQSCPAWQTHAAILDECATIATGWRARFWADRPLWNRIRRGRRLAKELAESAPVLQQARAAVAALPEGGPPLVILDLCSGFGYLGMFLSELLRPHAARVAKIVLVDIRWPPHGVAAQAHPNPNPSPSPNPNPNRNANRDQVRLIDAAAESSLLFLYNFTRQTMLGPFVAAGRAGLGLVSLRVRVRG